jgi:hypothetical protein
MSASIVLYFLAPLSSTFIAFAVAMSSTALELIVTKYPHTYFVLTIRKSPFFYVYTSLYGLIASLLMMTNFLHLEKYGLTNPWIQALVIGFTVKSLLHIRIFSIPKSAGGKEVVPIGLETIVHLFEPWLLRTIDIDEFNGVRAFLADWLHRYPDAASVGQVIENNLPERLLTDSECAFLIRDLKRAISDSSPDDEKKVQDALEIYLRYLGKKSLHQTFPLDNNTVVEQKKLKDSMTNS